MEFNISPNDLMLVDQKLFLSHDLFMWFLQSIFTAFLFGLFFGVVLYFIFREITKRYQKDEYVQWVDSQLEDFQ